MSIRKILQEGDNSKKTTARSFRLRPNAFKGLEDISQRTGISVNEALNIMLEEITEDYSVISNIEDFFYEHSISNVVCSKKLSNGLIRTIDVHSNL